MLTKQLQKYPNPIQEKENLADHSWQTHDTQNILEGLPKPTQHQKFFVTSLELVIEDCSLK